ncbi:MAG: RNA-binding transcriptional accessory protein [Anaerolineaceae bacterium]|nr:RNA-binding transcriptional accessory protein [Anaerolineaceae bacterium]
MLNYNELIAKEISVRMEQVQAVIELLDDGNTIPFISRYRKEVTGSLDEEQIRNISESVEKYRALDDRRKTIISSIEKQEKMTDELRAQINKAMVMNELEDLYLPYKPKRRTRAMIAKENGLQSLADAILQQTYTPGNPTKAAEEYICEAYPDPENVLSGAKDIVAEYINDHADIRKSTRDKAMKWASLSCEKIGTAEDQKNVFETYYEFEISVNRIRPHQILAINRGENEKILRVKVQVPERDWREAIGAHIHPNRKSPFHSYLLEAIDDAAERLLLPSIERDVRRELSESAASHAIQVFAENMRALLEQPPLSMHTVLGLDPGYRTGSKYAVIDPTGKIVDTGTIYPHKPQSKWNESKTKLIDVIDKYKVTLLSIGNGTASRESEQLAAEIIVERKEVKYLIVSEAGASVYSASPLARSEMPDLDVSIRGAVSIARRVQDPLAELVKIDPRSIGVGLYQHDVNQAMLSNALTSVVESVVNSVGVDLNTASPSLLTYISGIGPKLAEMIVAYRDENGKFASRAELLKISGLGKKAFQQSAGFLRIHQGTHPLDASSIHPESYAVAQKIIEKANIDFDDSLEKKAQTLEALKQSVPLDSLADQLKTGIPTLTDIFEQLIRPGRDPRLDTPAPMLRSDVLSMEDLIVGMQLMGTVRNVVDFGSFVDIGVKQDALLHRTQIPQGKQVRVGDILNVTVVKIEKERGRIGISWNGEKN